MSVSSPEPAIAATSYEELWVAYITATSRLSQATSQLDGVMTNRKMILRRYRSSVEQVFNAAEAVSRAANALLDFGGVPSGYVVVDVGH